MNCLLALWLLCLAQQTVKKRWIIRASRTNKSDTKSIDNFHSTFFVLFVNAISKPFDKTGTTIIDEVFEENKSLDSSFCNQRMAEGKRQHKKCFLRGKKTGEEEARRWWWLNIIKDILSASVFFFLSFFPFSFFCVVCYWPFWPQ